MTFTAAPSSRCPKFSTSSKAAATRSFMRFRQPRTGQKPQPPRSNGLPAPRPSSIRVHRKCAHCAKEYLAAMGRSPSRDESFNPCCCRSRSRKTWQSTWLGRDYDAEIMDTQAPQVSSSTRFTKIYGDDGLSIDEPSLSARVTSIQPASLRSSKRCALPYSHGRKRLAEWPQYQVQSGPMQPVSGAIWPAFWDQVSSRI